MLLIVAGRATRDVDAPTARAETFAVRDSHPAATRDARPVKGESTNHMAGLDSGLRRDPGRRNCELDDRGSRPQRTAVRATDTPLPSLCRTRGAHRVDIFAWTRARGSL